MYLDSTTTKKELMTSPPPFGGGFTKEQAAQATRMELWGSDWNEPAPDYCKFRLFDEKNTMIGEKYVLGY